MTEDKYEIEAEYRVVLGKMQWYAYYNGNQIGQGFDTESEAQALCDKICRSPKKRRYTYTPETEDEKTERHTSLDLTE